MKENIIQEKIEADWGNHVQQLRVATKLRKYFYKNCHDSTQGLFLSS